MAAVTICSDFGALKNEVCHCFHYLSICHEVMGLDAMSEKVGLKLNIQKTKIMASSPITSWETDGETVADFIFFELQNRCRW